MKLVNNYLINWKIIKKKKKLYKKNMFLKKLKEDLKFYKKKIHLHLFS